MRAPTSSIASRTPETLWDHAAGTLELAESLALRTYIPEPRRNHDSRWTEKPEGYQQAVYANRRRVGRAKSKALQKKRSEYCERTFAHICDTGGMRRSWLRGLAEVTKRYVIAAAAHNLGRIMRSLFGIGKPRSLQGLAGLVALLSLPMLRWMKHIQSAAMCRTVLSVRRRSTPHHSYCALKLA